MAVLKAIPDQAGSGAPARPARGRLFASAALLFVGLFLLLAAMMPAAANIGDYHFFYRCGELAFLEGSNPWDCVGFRNPPPAMLLLAPLAMLGAPADIWAWGLIVGLCAAAGLALLREAFAIYGRGGAYLLVVLGLGLHSFLLVFNHQLTAPVFLAECLAILWLRRAGGPAAAALVFAMILKPHLAVVLAPLLLLVPRRQAITAAIAGGAIFLLLSLPFAEQYLGGSGLLETVTQDDRWKLTLPLLFSRLLPDPLAAISSALLILPPLAYYIYQLWLLFTARAGDGWLAVAKAGAAALLWLPYDRTYDWVLVMFAYFVLWQYNGRRWTADMFWSLLIMATAQMATLLLWDAGLQVVLNPLVLLALIWALERAERGSLGRLQTGPAPAS